MVLELLKGQPMNTGLKMKRHHLVMLPGLEGNGRVFESFIQAIPGSVQARLASYPGDAKLNYQQLIPEVREAAPWDESYVLFAESFSGPLALLYAQAQWENVQGIVFCGSFVRNPLSPFMNWVYSMFGDAMFKKRPPVSLIKKYLLDRECPETLLEDVVDALECVEPDVLAHRIELMVETDVSEIFRELEIPMMYILPTKDELIGRRGFEYMRKLRPDLPYVEIDGPHLLVQSRPRDIWAAVDQFFQILKPENQAA